MAVDQIEYLNDSSVLFLYFRASLAHFSTDQKLEKPMATTLVQYAYEIKPLEFGQGGLFESLYDPKLEAFMKMPAHAVVCSPYWPHSSPLAIVPHVTEHITEQQPESPKTHPPRYPGSSHLQESGKVVVQFEKVPLAPGSVTFPHPGVLARAHVQTSNQGGTIAASRTRRSTRKRSSRSPDAAYDYSDSVDRFLESEFSDSDFDSDFVPRKKKRRGSGSGGRPRRSKSRSNSVARAPRRSVRLHAEPGTGDENTDSNMYASMSKGDDDTHMSPRSLKREPKNKHRKHYRYTFRKVCEPKEIAKHKWKFIRDHARVLEIMNRIFTGFKEDYGANWCRYCGAKTASSYSKSPWGPSKLCTKHYVAIMQKDTVNLSNHAEPTDPDKPINPDANCEIIYMNRMIRTYGVGAGVLNRDGKVIEV